MNCKNCENYFEGSYCNQCGQKSHVQRINFNYLINEISKGIFQIEHGLLFTIKELFVRPGHSIRAFLAGKRKPYFKPIAFIFLLSTIYAITTHFFEENTYLEDFVGGFSNGLTDDGDSLTNTAKVLNWMAANHAYTTLLLLPVFSFASYSVFVESKYNYFEHLVLNAYITGQQTLIYAVLSPLMYQIDDDNFLIGLPFLLAITFNFWAFIQFFIDKKLSARFFFTLLTYLFYYLLLLISIAIISGVGLLFE